MDGDRSPPRTATEVPCGAAADGSAAKRLASSLALAIRKLVRRPTPRPNCCGPPTPVGEAGAVKRTIVLVLAKLDEAVDEVLYRPLVVRLFVWAPRWWLCDLARFSMALDDRWSVGYWDNVGIAPGDACEACGRRAAIHVYGGNEEGEAIDPAEGFLGNRPVHVCGWCQLRGDIGSEQELQVVLAAARDDSVSWRWRWRVRP